MSESFFSSLPAINGFAGMTDGDSFHPAPDDWLLVVTDIRNSTAAVAAGRYRDVNMIGGAAICAVRNATGGENVPFVFGGDGTTMLISPQQRSAVETALVKTRNLARDDFGLDLRVAVVPVSAVRERGQQVLVARLQVAPGNDLALFGGGGVDLANELVKSAATEADYLIPERDIIGLPDLTGLSCRWEPLRSRHGSILCLLVSARADSFEQRQRILADLISRLSRVLGRSWHDANPVHGDSLQLHWPPRSLMSEARATRGNRALPIRVLELYCASLFHWLLDRSGWKVFDYQADRHRLAMQTHSDYCKFDDMLRVVLDCSAEQNAAIRTVLSDMQSQRLIDFGLFETDQALMTCLVFDLATSQQMHFIDGDNGGFWSAARDFKRQSEATPKQSDVETPSTAIDDRPRS